MNRSEATLWGISERELTNLELELNLRKAVDYRSLGESLPSDSNTGTKQVLIGHQDRVAGRVPATQHEGYEVKPSINSESNLRKVEKEEEMKNIWRYELRRGLGIYPDRYVIYRGNIRIGFLTTEETTAEFIVDACNKAEGN